MAEFEHMEEWVVGLHDRGIIGCAETRDDFIKLKSGRMSPHYANFRGIMSVNYNIVHYGEGHIQMNNGQQQRVRELTVEAGAYAIDQLLRVKGQNFDHIAPIPQAVTQLGGAIALRGGYSSVNVRVPEGEKGYGKHKPVEGDYRKGDRVIGFDDVVTTGDAKEEFLEPMRMAELEVPGFVVLLDRQEGGRNRIESLGYSLTPAVGVYAVKEILRDNNRISADQYGFIEEYLGEYGDSQQSLF